MNFVKISVLVVNYKNARNRPLNNLNDIVYVYGPQDYIGEGSMLDTLIAMSPSSREEVERLWRQLTP